MKQVFSLEYLAIHAGESFNPPSGLSSSLVTQYIQGPKVYRSAEEHPFDRAEAQCIPLLAPDKKKYKSVVSFRFSVLGLLLSPH